MWQYNYTPDSNELYHYGVPGMRWGHRKAKAQLQVAKKQWKKANKEFDKAYRDNNSWLLNMQFDKKDKQKRSQAMMDAASKAEKANRKYKRAKKAYKMVKKLEKQKVKDLQKKYQKEYLSDKSSVGKVVSKFLGSDKVYAKTMADMDKRGY